jgi:hypothetical protein
VFPVRSTAVVRRSLQGRQASPLDVGAAVGVALVLKGQVVSGPHHVSVLTQLTDVAARALVWYGRLQVRSDQLFGIEDVVAERVVAGLRLQLAAAEQERLRRRYTNHRDAYEMYLRGPAALAEYTPEGASRAISAFERALEHDAAYAIARALVRAVLSRDYRDHHVAYSVGAAYAQLGEADEALRGLVLDSRSPHRNAAVDTVA